MVMSTHASTRLQQRGVSPLILDLLLQFGARESAGDGAETVYFDRKAKRRLQSYSGNLISKLSEALDIYAVVSGNTVITVGCRYKRINHH